MSTSMRAAAKLVLGFGVLVAIFVIGGHVFGIHPTFAEAFMVAFAATAFRDITELGDRRREHKRAVAAGLRTAATAITDHMPEHATRTQVTTVLTRSADQILEDAR